jgi:hypothetical protein
MTRPRKTSILSRRGRAGCRGMAESLTSGIPSAFSQRSRRPSTLPSHVCARIRDLTTRCRDATSQNLKAIQSARAVRPSRRVLATCEVYVASPIPLLAPVMTTTLSLIPCMKFCILHSTFQFHIWYLGAFSLKSTSDRLQFLPFHYAALPRFTELLPEMESITC